MTQTRERGVTVLSESPHCMTLQGKARRSAYQELKDEPGSEPVDVGDGQADQERHGPSRDSDPVSFQHERFQQHQRIGARLMTE